MTGDLFMTFKKGGKQPGGIQKGSSFASRGNPSHDRGGDGEEEKKLDSCRLAWKSLPFCRDCAAPLFVTGAQIPTSARRSSRLHKKKKKKISRAQKDEDVVKSFASKRWRLDRQHFLRRRKRREVGSCCADRKILN